MFETARTSCKFGGANMTKVSRVNYEKALYSIGPLLGHDDREDANAELPRTSSSSSLNEGGGAMNPSSRLFISNQRSSSVVDKRGDAQRERAFSLLPEFTPTPGQPNDEVFDHKFFSKLSECSVPSEEKSKLMQMRNYLRAASRAINLYVFSRSVRWLTNVQQKWGMENKRGRLKRTVRILRGACTT